MDNEERILFMAMDKANEVINQHNGDIAAAYVAIYNELPDDDEEESEEGALFVETEKELQHRIVQLFLESNGYTFMPLIEKWEKGETSC